MHHRAVAGGWIVAAAMAVVLALGTHTAEAANKASATQKAATPKSAAGKKHNTGAAVTPGKSAAGRPDPDTLPPVDEPVQQAAQVQPAVSAPAPSQLQPVVTTQPAQLVRSNAQTQPSAAPPAKVKPQPKAVAEDAGEPEAPTLPASKGSSSKIGMGKATVLGIVEGLTEYLPVSSTGHLILASYWLGLAKETDERGAFGGHKIEASAAVDSFEIVIQLGAILAVLGLYRKRVGQMVRGLAGRSPNGFRLAMLLLVAFLPAAVIGLALHKKIEQHLFGPMPVVIALAVGGVLMIVAEHFFWTRRKSRIHAAIQTRSLTPVGSSRANSTGPMVNVMSTQPAVSRFTKVDTMQVWQAAVIGFAQCLAMWPGTSRSMITIVAALVVGLDMMAAAEFSFLLALPTLGAATLFSGYKHWHELMQATGVGGLLVGLIVSGIVAALAVKWFVGFLTRRGLMPFGVYRIVAALFLMLYFLR